MQTGVFLFGGVEMDDAGAGPPIPTDRRYDQKQMWEAALQLLEMGVEAEKRGYDSFWLTEHHFQYEGYEVVPNGVLFAVALAERTTRLKIGAMFNILPQWNPIRFAEDFATMHNLSGGRGLLGIGRGTVPREAKPLGSVVGSADNPDQAEDDRINREIFEESIEIILTAFENETFSHHGKHFDLPPPGIPDRGGSVEHLTLVPRPLYPYEVWQAITSPPTLEFVPQKGWGGVFWNKNHKVLAQWWHRFAELYEQNHGTALAPGEKRMLVLTTCVEDTHEKAVESARPGHDEFWKFLGPYGWSRGYLDDDGNPFDKGAIPTLEQSMDQKVIALGTAEDVAETISSYIEELGGVEHLTIFPNLPGDSHAKTKEQIQRFSEEVMPLLSGDDIPRQESA